MNSITARRKDKMKVILKKGDYEGILSWARKNLPEEACGLIAGTEEDDGNGGKIRRIEKVFFLENTDHSREHFTISPEAQLSALKEARAAGLKMLGNWHSHPDTPSRQSEEDKRLSFDHGASYMIVSLADRENPVLNSFHFDGTDSTKEELEIVDD